MRRLRWSFPSKSGSRIAQGGRCTPVRGCIQDGRTGSDEGGLACARCEGGGRFGGDVSRRGPQRRSWCLYRGYCPFDSHRTPVDASVVPAAWSSRNGRSRTRRAVDSGDSSRIWRRCRALSLPLTASTRQRRCNSFNGNGSDCNRGEPVHAFRRADASRPCRARRSSHRLAGEARHARCDA